MSFQTFTSFIPRSWSSSQQPASATPAASSLSHSASSSISEATVVVNVASLRKCGYVSRKKQLQLLKARMEMEGVGTMRTHMQCKKCDGDLVFIWDRYPAKNNVDFYSSLICPLLHFGFCFVHTLHVPLSVMHRALFYAYYALFPFFSCLACSRSSPHPYCPPPHQPRNFFIYFLFIFMPSVFRNLSPVYDLMSRYSKVYMYY